MIQYNDIEKIKPFLSQNDIEIEIKLKTKIENIKPNNLYFELYNNRIGLNFITDVNLNSETLSGYYIHFDKNLETRYNSIDGVMDLNNWDYCGDDELNVFIPYNGDIIKEIIPNNYFKKINECIKILSEKDEIKEKIKPFLRKMKLNKID